MSHKILIADDQHKTVEETARYLSNQGLDVVVAHTGNEAFAILESEQIDVMVVDIHMPRTNGILLLEQSRFELDLITPVIVISCDPGKRLLDYMSLFDIREFFEKPLRPEKIYRAICRALNIDAN